MTWPGMTPMVSTLVLALALPTVAQYNPCGGKKQGMNPCNPCASGTTFTIDDPMGRNQIVFKSEAPLEDIIGTTNQITGWIAFDPNNPGRGVRGEFSVPVASLNTGIPLRDEHLRGKDWLDAAQYPNIELKIQSVEGVRVLKQTDQFRTFEGQVQAELSLHGRTQSIRFPGRLTFLKESETTKAKLPGDLVALKADFDVSLADFGVSGPAGMGIVGSKVGETIAVEVSIMGTNASTKMAGNPCNPCTGKKAVNPCSGKKSVKNPCNPCG